MDEEQWLAQLLEASRAALERVRGPGLDVDRQFVADIEAFCLQIEQQLGELRSGSED
ncbi:MAG TPA: hypothetical protein VF236_01270 [Gaiellaceae bacterium]